MFSPGLSHSCSRDCPVTNRKSPGRIPTVRIQGVSGPAAGDEDGAGRGRPTGPGKIPTPLPSSASSYGTFCIRVSQNHRQQETGPENFQGMHLKVQKSKMGGDRLKTAQATVASFLMQPFVKSWNYFWQERKRRRVGRPLEKNSSDPGIISWSHEWAGKWFWPGTYPPQPRVGARWRPRKEKEVTDFSVTPWHSSWWSWRESNPRPLECHASSLLKSLDFG